MQRSQAEGPNFDPAFQLKHHQIYQASVYPHYAFEAKKSQSLASKGSLPLPSELQDLRQTLPQAAPIPGPTLLPEPTPSSPAYSFLSVPEFQQVPTAIVPTSVAGSGTGSKEQRIESPQEFFVGVSVSRPPFRTQVDVDHLAPEKFHSGTVRGLQLSQRNALCEGNPETALPGRGR